MRFDNAPEFTSPLFVEYMTSIGVTIQTSAPYAHHQNGMAEAMIKREQTVIRTLLLGCKLPMSAWGHAALHAAQLLRLRPVADNTYSPYQLATGNAPSVAHLRTFGCAAYVPIPPTKRSKIGPQRRLAIYVGFDSPSKIRHIDPLTGDLHFSSFNDTIFDETVFPTLGGVERNESNGSGIELNWRTNEPDNYSHDGEDAVKRFLELQHVAANAPDMFAHQQRVTKSLARPISNTPARIDIDAKPAVDVAPPRKRGRPIGSTDSETRVRRKTKQSPTATTPATILPRERSIQDETPQTTQLKPISQASMLLEDVNSEEDIAEIICQTDVLDGSTLPFTNISIDSTNVHVMSFHVEKSLALEDPDPTSIQDAKKSPNWPNWLEAIKSELNSLNQRQVFGPVQECPDGARTVGSRWIFTRKRDTSGKIIRYKARLVAQGFSQRFGIDYVETYSPVVDNTTFRYLISFSVRYILEMKLMDVVTAYLYGPIDSDVYMNIPEGLNTSSMVKRKPCLKLQRSLYGLKQAGRMWYQYLRDFLVECGFMNSELCPCVFIKQHLGDFVILAVYVDDINLIGSKTAVDDAAKVLGSKFHMKDLGKTSLCLGLKMEHMESGVLVHQTHYTRKILKRFGTSDAHPCRTPLVVRTLDPPERDAYGPIRTGVDKSKKKSHDRYTTDPGTCPSRSDDENGEAGTGSHPCMTAAAATESLSRLPTAGSLSLTIEAGGEQLPGDDPSRLALAYDDSTPNETDDDIVEVELGSEFPYREAIGALMYLANSTRPDIAFAVNLLARYSSRPTKRHWAGVKQILRYLRGTEDYGLFFQRKSESDLVGYADAGYLSDPHSCRSQTGYVFLSGGTAISWRSSKQTLVTTSSNHAEIVALFEACKECVWLRSVQQFVKTSCGMAPSTNPTTIFEDNSACVSQVNTGFIKGDRTKHIAPKMFYAKELKEKGMVNIQYVKSNDNFADIFTKSLPAHKHWNIVP